VRKQTRQRHHCRHPPQRSGTGNLDSQGIWSLPCSASASLLRGPACSLACLSVPVTTCKTSLLTALLALRFCTSKQPPTDRIFQSKPVFTIWHRDSSSHALLPLPASPPPPYAPERHNEASRHRAEGCKMLCRWPQPGGLLALSEEGEPPAPPRRRLPELQLIAYATASMSVLLR